MDEAVDDHHLLPATQVDSAASKGRNTAYT